MRIAEVYFKNWGPFPGEHTLKLEAKAYAVVARAVDNQERSNWLGKSMLLEGVDFGLHGRHRFRTEDEWITHGESIGEVKLTFDDDSWLRRHRERGKKTALTFMGPTMKDGAMQDRAQECVRELVGLDPEDFLVTCYFQQRQMARLILADPGPRMELVSGWLRLGPLEACEADVKEETSKLADEVKLLETQLQGLADLEKHSLEGGTRVDLEAKLADLSATLEKRRAAWTTASNAVSANAGRISAQGTIEQFEVLIEDGRKLRAEIEKQDGKKLRAEHEVWREYESESNTKMRMARGAVEEKRNLSKGEFDGVCPVAGIKCPATEDINRDRKRGLNLLDEAKVVCAQAEKTYAHAKGREQDTRAAMQEFDRRESKLHMMREQAARMEDDYERARNAGEVQDPILLRARLDEATQRLDEAMRGAETIRAKLAQLDQVVERRVTLQSGLVELRAKLATQREGQVIFGKQGAQRRVAEWALSQIEDGANQMLREAALDLSVSVRWSREGSGPARACDACGNPFPSSVKIKVCSKCSAARGPNLINKLDFVLSNRSGAAEDLGGVALQLSAAAWLRAERGSLWETALLDEPFGACDAYNRRALGRHLAALLGGRYGFGQALVVAHSSDVLGALPGRIEIEGGPDGSTVRVAA